MMNNYEAILIIKPDLKEEDLKNVFKTAGELITKSGGNVKKEESWGKRQLAYPVNKFKEGYYYKVDFEAPASEISKVEAAYKLSLDVVLRTMITRR